MKKHEVTAGVRSQVPALKCMSGQCADGPDVVKCHVDGTDYRTGDPLWKCTADLPNGLRFGSTDVTCEGYRHPEDEYVTRGSCGLEYTLIGQAARPQQSTGYAHQEPHYRSASSYPTSSSMRSWANILFWCFAAWLLFRFISGGSWSNVRRANAYTATGGGGGGGGGGWFGGGGGGGGFWPGYGGGYGGANCPPGAGAGAGGGPGFWTGLGVGGLLGNLWGRHRGVHAPNMYGAPTYAMPPQTFGGGGGGRRGDDNRQAAGGTHTATGYGTTRRR